MSHATVLMYHVLYDTIEEWEALRSDERPYAISTSEFKKQLDILEVANISILDPYQVLKNKSFNCKNKGVLLTFDDGHSSFYKYAYKILKERGFRAIFFITTDLIVKRDDFCTWANLSEMAQEGFMIQSHGKTHKFFPELDESSLELEFKEPKELLEKHTGQKIFVMSFPGGRYQAREINVGMKFGYEAFFTSRIGTLTEEALQNKNTFDRVVIRNGIKLNTFLGLSEGRALLIWPQKFNYNIKLFIKFILGNNFYHILYKKLFS